MELLQRRKFCREFLNGYNEKLHPQIISKVFEIGLLTLKKNYNKLLFTKEELDDIIRDLNENNYTEIVPLPSLKQINSQRENQYLNTESNDTDAITTKLIKRHKLYNNTLKNPNFSTQNSAIYPNWWWNNKEEEEEDEDEERPKNNINTIFNDDGNNNNDYDNIEYNNVINGIYDENNYNLEYINSKNRNEELDENDNNEINSKNYTINKLTMNSINLKRNNRYDNNDVYIYQEKRNNIPYNNNSFKRNQIKKINAHNKNNIKKEIKQRVRSSKITNRNNISNNNIIDDYDKKYKKINKPNSKLVKIPKYRYTYINGKVLRIPEDNNNIGNLTMPSK